MRVGAIFPRVDRALRHVSFLWSLFSIILHRGNEGSECAAVRGGGRGPGVVRACGRNIMFPC